MSGICGIVNFDGAPAPPDALARMVEAQANRGPDGAHTWIEGAVGLAHLAFHTTPESQREQQPLVSPSGRIALVADARIDNRSELISTLTASGHLQRRNPTDADLILAAYERWGEATAKRLIGDFAFAIWDSTARKLVAARDAIGVRQFYYALVDNALYFGSTIGAVLAGLPRQPTLNSPLIEAFLRRDFAPWVCGTVYNEVHRPPPAHTLTVQEGRASTQLYHVLGSGWSGPAYTSDQEWMEAFRALLAEAIRCRLRSTTPVGIMVSGGLDSSSLACLAYEQWQTQPGLPQVRLYTSIFEETPTADEREYFEAVAARCANAASTRLVSDHCWALREFGGDNGYPLEEPEVDIMRSFTLICLRAAAADGCRVVMAGEGGDAFLGQHMYFYPAALRNVGLRDWPAEAHWFRVKGGRGWGALLFDAYVRPLLSGRLPGWTRDLRSRRARPTPWVRRLPGQAAERPGCQLAAAFHRPPGLTASAQVAHFPFRLAYNIARYSGLDACMAHAGVEWRLPFLDRRLIDFLLHVPHHLRAWRGVDRVLLRESMRGFLPEQVRTRRSKSHFAALIGRGLREERLRIEHLLADSRAEALGFIETAVLRQAFEAYWAGGVDDDRPLRTPLCLEAWLREGTAVPF